MAWLITGASGFIGSRVVQKLPKTEVVLHIHGEQEKDKKQAEKFRASGFSVFEGDLTKKETLQNIPTGLSGIVHTANIAGGNDARLLQANPGTTRLVGQAAKQHKVGTVVYLSSVAVYGETPVEGAAENFRPSPNTLYGESKLAAEEILKLAVEKRDISSAVILRLNSVYGPGQEKGFIYHHISNITNRGYFQIDGMGNQVRQPVFVDDVVDIIAKFIKLIKNPLSGFEIFNVAGSATITVKDLGEKIGQILKVQPRVKDSGRPPQKPEVSVQKIDRAAQLLEWRPKVALEQGLVLTCRALREKPAQLH